VFAAGIAQFMFVKGELAHKYAVEAHSQTHYVAFLVVQIFFHDIAVREYSKLALIKDYIGRVCLFVVIFLLFPFFLVFGVHPCGH
jgi:hypothetical protein